MIVLSVTDRNLPQDVAIRRRWRKGFPEDTRENGIRMTDTAQKLTKALSALRGFLYGGGNSTGARR